MPSPSQIKAFSTTTKVYPPILPYMHTSVRVSRRWVAPVIVMATISVGLAAAHKIHAKNRESVAVTRAREAEEIRHRQKMLMEAYGDRTNIKELERAVQAYEKS